MPWYRSLQQAIYYWNQPAYQQGESGECKLLTDGVKSAGFPAKVGKTNDGKFIITDVGFVPGAVEKRWQPWISYDVYNLPEVCSPVLGWRTMLAARSSKELTRALVFRTKSKWSRQCSWHWSQWCLRGLSAAWNWDGNKEPAAMVDIDQNGDVVGVTAMSGKSQTMVNRCNRQKLLHSSGS